MKASFVPSGEIEYPALLGLRKKSSIGSRGGIAAKAQAHGIATNNAIKTNNILTVKNSLQ